MALAEVKVVEEGTYVGHVGIRMMM